MIEMTFDHEFSIMIIIEKKMTLLPKIVKDKVNFR